MQKQALDKLFSRSWGHPLNKFPSLSIKAMNWLQLNNKTNVLYNLPYGLATERPPVKRMPFGLLEYNIYFLATSTQQAVCNSL